MTQQTTAIYALAADDLGMAHVATLRDALGQACDRVITVQFGTDEQGQYASDGTLPGPGTEPDPLIALAAALTADPEIAAHRIVVTGSNAIGPLRPISECLEAAAGAALYSAYWHDLSLDPRFKHDSADGRIPYFDFAVFGPGVWENAGLREMLDGLPAPRDDNDALRRVQMPFAKAWSDAGYSVTYAMAADRLETFEPHINEVHKLVEDRAPVIPLAVLKLDPVQHDLRAIYMRQAFDQLRIEHPAIYAAIGDYASRKMALRDFSSMADQYAVLPMEAQRAPRDTWAFGRVAVFIHAFYANMMPEFWDLIERLPCKSELHITTASEDDKVSIEAFLAEKGWASNAREVRVVEQNRGRDMSSLFITWRDVIAANRYEVALRLHSKRTPQVPRQVGESFKDHLFDNLVPSPGYVANLLDMMEAEPDIGLVIPPVIHMGFGTLGHSWYTNKPRVRKLLAQIGINVKLDEATPVAPYGTMYWFRTAALAPMFEHDWRWEDYNAEPNHVDGGLAHAQERMIGYVAQGTGYRVMSVMNPLFAARSYAKLEYKLQKLASYLAVGSIQEQVGQLEAANASFKMRMYHRMKLVYGAMLIRYPKLRGPLRPIKNLIIKLVST